MENKDIYFHQYFMSILDFQLPLYLHFKAHVIIGSFNSNTLASHVMILCHHRPVRHGVQYVCIIGANQFFRSDVLTEYNNCNVVCIWLIY